MKSPIGARLFTKELMLILGLFLIPMSVQANIFSNFVSYLAKDVAITNAIEAADYSPTHTPLLSANQIDPVAATGGGNIMVQDGTLVSTAPVTEAERAESPRNGGEISVYTVREGDSLSEIAEMYNVTTNTILWANDISRATGIKAGDVLVILPIVGVRHEVTKGETLASIIKKYDADLDEVLEYNGLTTADELSIGMELMIPGGSITTTTKLAGRPAPTKSSGASAGALGFSHPVPGAVRTQGIHGYNGVDYGGAPGTSIRAAAAGEVIISKSTGWNGGYGQYVVIRHANGTQTLYAHLSSNSVATGDWVASGQVIGGMGNTGRSTGTHLHFEVRGASNPF